MVVHGTTQSVTKIVFIDFLRLNLIMSSGLSMITTLYSPPRLPGARFLRIVGRREGREVEVGTVIVTPDPPGTRPNEKMLVRFSNLVL